MVDESATPGWVSCLLMVVKVEGASDTVDMDGARGAAVCSNPLDTLGVMGLVGLLADAGSGFSSLVFFFFKNPKLGIGIRHASGGDSRAKGWDRLIGQARPGMGDGVAAAKEAARQSIDRPISEYRRSEWLGRAS